MNTLFPKKRLVKIGLLLALATLSTSTTSEAKVVNTVISDSPPMAIAQDEEDPDQQANYFNVLERNKVSTDIEYLDTGLMGDTIDVEIPP